MGYKYEYNPSLTKKIMRKIEEINEMHQPKIIFIAVIFIVAVSLFSLGWKMTGYVAYTKNVEELLNDTQIELKQTITLKEKCESDLETTQNSLRQCNLNLENNAASLVECEEKKSEAEKYSDELNVLLTDCKTERDEFEGKYNTLSEEYDNITVSYDELIKNLAKAVCCSYGDIQEGRISHWSVENNTIVCHGEYNVNCSTGETDYP